MIHSKNFRPLTILFAAAIVTSCAPSGVPKTFTGSNAVGNGTGGGSGGSGVVSAGSVVFLTQPGGAGAGLGWPQQPIVRVLTTAGAAVTKPLTIKLSIASGTAGAKLIGYDVNNRTAAGLVSFSNLSIDRAGTYTLRASVDGYDSATSLPFTVGAQTGNTYYVSSAGSDSNTGRSTAAAWRTIAKVNASNFGPGDSVLFAGGETFTGCLTLGTNVTGTPANPVVVGSFGTGQFTLQANCTKSESSYSVITNPAAIKIGGLQGLVIQDCILRGNQAAVQAAGATTPPTYGAVYGILFNNGFYGSNLATRSVTVRNCDISGFYTPHNSDFGGDIFLNLSGPTSRITIVNNVIHGSSGTTSPDDNGIGVSGQAVGSRLTDFVAQSNHIYNIGGRANAPGGTVGSGIVIAGKRLLIQHNVAHDNGAHVNTCGGSANIWAVEADEVTIQYNEVYRANPKDQVITTGHPNYGGCDWNGFDLDIDVTNSFVQYNYSHENFGSGYLAFIDGTWTNNVFRFNVSAQDASPNGGFGALSITNWHNVVGTVDYYNNIFDASSSNGLPIYSGGTNTVGLVANNIFRRGAVAGVAQMTNLNGANLPMLRFDTNAYWAPITDPSKFDFYWGTCTFYGICRGLSNWQTTVGQDPSARPFTATPAPLPTPSAAVTCPVSTILNATGHSGLASCLSGYFTPTVGSTALGSGLDIRAVSGGRDPGSHDFFGNPIPETGASFDIGVTAH
ncbi:MAG: hypothetical protein EOP11_02185 [Proteobacteria bacterium]|nr:MAG: hypothetical protein EOP11_02185 [Pseudomonadota bacterium]